MPIDRAHRHHEAHGAESELANAKVASPMWAFTLLEGRNDTDDDAQALADLARGFAEKYGKSPRISLIPYNAAPGLSFARSARMEAFRDALHARGVGSI